MKRRPRVCLLCARRCCTRPAPVNHDALEHERGVSVADTDTERRWWRQCWTCGAICTCEV